MLVLTRKVGESIRIGDDVVVTIVSEFNGKFRIGIEAPRKVLVLRGEVADRQGTAGGNQIAKPQASNDVEV